MTENKLDYSAELNVQVLQLTDQIRRLQTIIRFVLKRKQVKRKFLNFRDIQSTRSDFVFSADRLIRLVVEEGLNQLPYKVKTFRSPYCHSLISSLSVNN